MSGEKIPITIVDGNLCCPNCGGAIVIDRTRTSFRVEGQNAIISTPVYAAGSAAGFLQVEDESAIALPSCETVFECLECDKLSALCMHFDSAIKQTVIHWASVDVEEDEKQLRNVDRSLN